MKKYAKRLDKFLHYGYNSMYLLYFNTYLYKKV